MIIPVKCFTCGTVIGDKYKYFINEVAKQKKENDIDDKIQYLDTNQKIERTIEGKVLDQLNLRRICCRRHMLTHVDIF
jgi:DNA-directed RNA polymerase subunit N (RpoN/RPB10)